MIRMFRTRPDDAFQCDPFFLHCLFHHIGGLFFRIVGAVVSDNRAALLQTDNAFGGKPQSLRQVIMDGRGAVAALAAIAAGSSNPDILAFLEGFGALQRDMTYAGTGCSGPSACKGRILTKRIAECKAANAKAKFKVKAG